jgi:hypothetical protein
VRSKAAASDASFDQNTDDGLVMLTVNAVRVILSFSMLSEVELERLALSAAGVHLVRSQ